MAADSKAEAEPSAVRRSTRKHATSDATSLELELPLQLNKRRKLVRPRAAPKDDVSGSNVPGLPFEIWLQIIDCIGLRDYRTLASLSRVSKAFHQAISPALYHSIVAAAPSSPNIRSFIRLIERFLSPTQRKILKAEKRYEGQQKRFPKDIDESTVPYCSGYANRLLVGWSNPGRSHVDMIARYLEEMLANLTNLEALVWHDTHVPLTSAICNRIASLKNLRALAFNFTSGGDLSALSQIKGLVYFDIYVKQDRVQLPVIKDIIWQSQKTLETLIYDDSVYTTGDYADIVSLFHQHGATIQFPNLTTLCIRPDRMDKQRASWLLEAINFERLHYFEYSKSQTHPDSESFNHDTFFKMLLEKHGANSGGPSLTLKTFRFRSQRHSKTLSRDILALIESFDTLETFIYEQPFSSTYHEEGEEELPTSSILSALKGHKRLRWFGVHGPSRGSGQWRFTPKQLEIIRDSFPELTHLSCLCNENEKDDFFAVLPTFQKLKFYHLPIAKWFQYPEASRSVHPAESIIRAFLKDVELGADLSAQRWEDRYNLSMLVTGSTAYEIASNFPSTKKQTCIPVEIETSKVKVCYQPAGAKKRFEGAFQDLNFMQATEWTSRNYDGTNGDWFQGIKFRKS